MGQSARLAGGDIAIEVGDDAERQIVGLDLLLDDEFDEFRAEAPMAPDHALQQPLVRQDVETPVLPVALARRIDEREIARGARFAKSFLQRQQQLIGNPDPDEARRADRITRLND